VIGFAGPGNSVCGPCITGSSTGLHGPIAISVLISRRPLHSASVRSQSKVPCPRSKHHQGGPRVRAGWRSCTRTMASAGMIGRMLLSARMGRLTPFPPPLRIPSAKWREKTPQLKFTWPDRRSAASQGREGKLWRPGHGPGKYRVGDHQIISRSRRSRRACARTYRAGAPRRETAQVRTSCLSFSASRATEAYEQKSLGKIR
jgi:hypothetical protein